MFNGKKLIHIVCCGMNGEIGANNSLLWNIPAELNYFKECTLGHVVLMGRKTYESLPKPLERRVTLEVTGKWNRKCGGCLSEEDILNANLNLALSHSNTLNTDCIFIAGGGQLYKATEKYVDEVWYTRVFNSYPEADTFYELPEGMGIYDSSQIMQFLDKKSGEYVGVQFIKLSK